MICSRIQFLCYISAIYDPIFKWFSPKCWAYSRGYTLYFILGSNVFCLCLMGTSPTFHLPIYAYIYIFLRGKNVGKRPNHSLISMFICNYSKAGSSTLFFNFILSFIYTGEAMVHSILRGHPSALYTDVDN